MRYRSLAVAALLVLFVVNCGGGAPSSDGSSEGIQVHGDWTIDVYNPDGTLDSKQQFSNALTNGGGQLLAGMLGDVTYAGTWAVEVYSAFADSPCVDEAGTNTSCWMYQHLPILESYEGPALSLNLQMSTQDNTLTLTGSHEASADGEITEVETRLYTCDEPKAAAECSGLLSNSVNFTHKSLDASDQPQVSTGQTIEVEVVLSFVSG